MRNFMFLLSILFVFVSVTGCASMRQNSAREAHINRGVKSYVHTQGVSRVFPEARKILFEHGYQTRDSDRMTLETEWGHDGYNTEIRYLVVAQQVSGGHQIHFMKNELKDGERRPTVTRDLDMEWTLIQRVDPQFTSQLQAEADAVARRTK